MNIYQANRPPTMPFWNDIVCGDSATLLNRLPANSVDLVITSPPYFNQRDYDGLGIGKESTVEQYIENLLVIFQECVRVLRDTGSIVFNLGDKYENSSLLLVPYQFAMVAASRCLVKLVNNITWVKSNPTPRQFRRRLVSSTEPFFHFVKSDNYQYFLDEFLKHKGESNGNDPAGANVGKGYFKLIHQSNLSPEQKVMAQEALQQVINEAQSGQIQGFRMKIRGIHSEPFGGQAGGRKIQLERNGFTIIRIHGHPMKKDVIESPVESLKNCPHPAIYPVQVVKEFLNLLTKPDDVVLDPFVGSGSTAVAAKQLNRVYIGFDLNPAYCDYANARLNEMRFQYMLLEPQNDKFAE